MWQGRPVTGSKAPCRPEGSESAPLAESTLPRDPHQSLLPQANALFWALFHVLARWLFLPPVGGGSRRAGRAWPGERLPSPCLALVSRLRSTKHPSGSEAGNSTSDSLSPPEQRPEPGMQAQIQSSIYTFIYIRIFTSEENRSGDRKQAGLGLLASAHLSIRVFA